MRLATITNWAYGTTVALTLISGATMVLASHAQDQERSAVEQRYELDQATSTLDEDIFALSDDARQFLNTGDPTYRIVYQNDAKALSSVEARIAHIGDAGAGTNELETLKQAIHWADALRDEQETAIAAHLSGDEARARTILFGGEYERELERIRTLITHFQDRLDRRAEAEVRAATGLAQVWKTVSEVAIAITCLLFLCVLFFVFKQRVLRPVVKLSDVVNRLAAQDYAAEPPEIAQIDEIGDMAQAVRVFRENGLERQRLEAERNADRAIRDLLSRMTQRMQGCDTLGDLQEVVKRFLPEIAPLRAGRLYLVDKQRNAVIETCNWLGPVHSRREFAPSMCWALRRGLPHRPTGGNIDVPCEHLDVATATMPDTLCLPLTAQQETLGLLYLEPCGAGAIGNDVPDVYLYMLAENVSLALANLRLRDRLREMAMADPLTGLANRRQLDLLFEEQVDHAQRHGQPLACLMIDVDHFKRFNDMFGHEAGDAVLREVGALLKSVTREPELAFRYGGEEFTLLAPGIGPEQAAERAEEIRKKIATLSLAHGGEDLGTISASIGVACAPEQCRFNRLIPTADAALLHAKARGRNRVELAQAQGRAKAMRVKAG